ncbi:MAG: 3-hydroxybutyrate oligomer hydrolase family protein [Myxococcales bacterium]|nr:D-(-)-3-hydroxybutyrate oligomer hydrolase [Myxococcales bacterium]
MRTVIMAGLLSSLALAAPAQAVTCGDVLARIGGQLADVNCFHSPDLTTANPATGPFATTPANNAILTLPALAFTPITDRGVISPTVHTAIAGPVPGIQLDARYADDATGEARFLLRLPDTWNGDLVVAGASGTRSEFNGDWAWSDYVLQKGFAYASQNKGILNLFLVGVSVAAPASDPLACRLNPLSPVWVHFYDNDPAKPFTEWQSRMVQAARTAREGVKGAYDHFPRHTFAVGTSNGGYQVRRAVEEAPDLFDGGVDWEGTFVDGDTFNILSDLPAALRNFPSNPAAIEAAGYPPDIHNAAGASLYANYWGQFWEVTQCQWQKRLDPTYDTYGAGAANYDYFARTQVSDVEQNLNAFATTGKIKVPLITVAGTMDALLPIKHHARAYADKVAASRKGNDDQRSAQYRLYEVQNGNHIETYVDQFPQLQLIQPHAQKAFDLLVDHVENGAALPPDQCIPRNGTISGNATPGRCAQLLAP